MNYFHYVGGFNLKEALNLCLKEGLVDAVTPLFTWFGREGGQRNPQRPLYNTRLVLAIYGTIISLYIFVDGIFAK